MSNATYHDRVQSELLARGIKDMAQRISRAAHLARERDARDEFCGIEAYADMERAKRALLRALADIEPFAAAYNQMIGEAA